MRHRSPFALRWPAGSATATGREQYRTLLRALVHVGGPLLAGALVYAASYFGWPCPPVIDHHLPDALWAYALCAALLLVWPIRYARGVALVALLLASLYECGQATPYWVGTFDPLDLLVQAVGCAWAYCSALSASSGWQLTAVE